MDLLPKRTEGEGFYVIHYGGRDCAAGPYASIKEMAQELLLDNYPDNGYVAYMDEHGDLSNVPSLNPDDLLPNPLFA